MLVAIHQPNFFPWLGFFDKIRRADIFIFLDAVDYPRTGAGNWVNRVKLAMQHEARWITCPVRQSSTGSHINTVEIDNGQPWQKKMLGTLQANYTKAEYYTQTMDLIRPLIEAPYVKLAAFNINAILAIAARLGLNAHFVRQSELTYEGKATELLISLVKAVGGSAYLAGGGASGYQEDDLFAANDITLIYQNFAPQPYGTAESYIPSLSVIDYLMHKGSYLNEDSAARGCK